MKLSLLHKPFILPKRLLLFAFQLVLLQCHCHYVWCKVSSGKILLTGENSEALITKFAVYPNTVGTFQMTLRIDSREGMYTDERNLKIHIFGEREWDGVVKSQGLSCRQKFRNARKYLPVSFEFHKVYDKYNYPDSPDGLDMWVAEINDVKLDSTRVDHKMFYYITLDDCSLEESYHSKQDAPPMTFRYVIQNENYNHFSADEDKMTALHMMQVILSGLLFVYIFFICARTFASSKNKKSIHLVLLITWVATLLDILSGVSELIHQAAYAYNGYGNYAMDCFASHFEAQCDATIALLLLFIGSGWTLPKDIIIADSGHDMNMINANNITRQLIAGLRSPFGGTMVNPATILIGLILALHAILAQWARTYDDDFDTYHTLEHFPGIVLMIFRSLLGAVFLGSVASVKNNGRCPLNLHPFLNKFMMIGFLWFLSLPLISFFVSKVISRGYKHYMLSAGSACIQSWTLAALVWMFTANENASAYHKISKASVQSGINTSGGFGRSASIDDDATSFLDSTASSSSSAPSKGFFSIGKTKIRID